MIWEAGYSLSFLIITCVYSYFPLYLILYSVCSEVSNDMGDWVQPQFFYYYLLILIFFSIYILYSVCSAVSNTMRGRVQPQFLDYYMPILVISSMYILCSVCLEVSNDMGVGYSLSFLIITCYYPYFPLYLFFTLCVQR